MEGNKGYGVWLRRLGLALAFVTCLGVALAYMSGAGQAAAATGQKTTGKWVVELYMCGTDLESRGGAATNDLVELTAQLPPEGVTFVIQTGGAKTWYNETVKPQELDRFIYDQDGLRRLEPQPDADMAAADTLAGFLRFAQDNFAADHRVLIVWDHGGGTVGGACYDERTQHMMSLNQMQEALASVYENNRETPPFDIVGFDCCLMATYGVANNFEGYGRYLVASQELEPGNGWYYSGIVKGLQEGVGSEPFVLAQVMCDSYMEGCRAAGTADAATLSVTDLSKLPQLREAYEQMGIEAIKAAEQAPKQFFSRYARKAKQAVSFGGNTRDTGYTNMIDMGDFAQRTEDLLPAHAQKVQQALAAAVSYKVNGPLKKGSQGLSCYYPYQIEQQTYFEQVRAASEQYKSLYRYLATGEAPSPEGLVVKFDVAAMEDLPVDADKDGTVFCKMTPQQMENLAAVRCDLILYDGNQNFICMYGNDANVDVDWDQGVCKDNFNGTWMMLDKHPVYTDVTEQTEDHITYAIPIKLNGQDMNLFVVYEGATGKYRILGARAAINEQGAADRNLVQLKPGDTVTTQQYVMGGGQTEKDFKAVDAATFQLGEHFAVTDEPLPDGTYGYVFDFITPTGDYAMSGMAFYELQKGDITTSVAAR